MGQAIPARDGSVKGRARKRGGMPPREALGRARVRRVRVAALAQNSFGCQACSSGRIRSGLSRNTKPTTTAKATTARKIGIVSGTR